jgi:hypothetical protein
MDYRERNANCLRLHIPSYDFLVKLEYRAEFNVGDVVMDVFAVNPPHFSHHSLNGTKTLPGEIHDIPVLYYRPRWYFVYQHDYRQIDALEIMLSEAYSLILIYRRKWRNQSK